MLISTIRKVAKVMNEEKDLDYNLLFDIIVGPIRNQLMDATPSELPIFNILNDENRDIVFGPASDIIGCMVMEVDAQAFVSVAFMISSPQSRIEVGGNWNYVLEKAWKAEIKEFLDESVSQYDGESSVIVHWDPYSDYYRKINQTFLCEYVEEITGRTSIVQEILEHDINRRLEKRIIGNEIQHRRDS
jgi:hypothetical protein